MNIQQATKEALKAQGMMYRKSILDELGARNVYIRPTNSYDTCILILFEKGKEVGSCRNWNPTAEDLMADDWEVLRDEFTGAEGR